MAGRDIPDSFLKYPEFGDWLCYGDPINFDIIDFWFRFRTRPLNKYLKYSRILSLIDHEISQARLFRPLAGHDFFSPSNDIDSNHLLVFTGK